MTKKLFAIMIGLAIVFAAGTTLAGNTSDTAVYSITIIDGCTVDTSGMTTDFGSYFLGDPNLVNVGAGSLSIACRSGLGYAWGIDKGVNPPGGEALRMHDGSGNYVTYNLEEGGTDVGDVGLNGMDGTYTEQWTTVAARNATGTGAPQIFNLNADVNIPGGGGTPGTYTDTVTVTVAWP